MKVAYRDLGTMEYEACWKLQQAIFDAALARKAAHLTSESAGELLLVEHPPVYTLGKSGKNENLLVSEQYLASLGAAFFPLIVAATSRSTAPGSWSAIRFWISK